MAASGEMTEDALRECSLMPYMDYEVHGILDFEGLEEAKELLTSLKKRRREAGIDEMLTAQGPTPDKRRERNNRRILRLKDRSAGAKETLVKMRALEAEGYDARQIGLQVIVPHVGRKMSAKALSRKMAASEKTRNGLRFSLSKRKAKAKAKAKAEAMPSGESSWQDLSNPSRIAPPPN